MIAVTLNAVHIEPLIHTNTLNVFLCHKDRNINTGQVEPTERRSPDIAGYSSGRVGLMRVFLAWQTGHTRSPDAETGTQQLVTVPQKTPRST